MSQVSRSRGQAHRARSRGGSRGPAAGSGAPQPLLLGTSRWWELTKGFREEGPDTRGSGRRTPARRFPAALPAVGIAGRGAEQGAQAGSGRRFSFRLPQLKFLPEPKGRQDEATAAPSGAFPGARAGRRAPAALAPAPSRPASQGLGRGKRPRRPERPPRPGPPRPPPLAGPLALEPWEAGAAAPAAAVRHPRRASAGGTKAGVGRRVPHPGAGARQRSTWRAPCQARRVDERLPEGGTQWTPRGV